MTTSLDVFYISGSAQQRQVVIDALGVCDFPFERLLPRLREGRPRPRARG
jgi:hypothetical protein